MAAGPTHPADIADARRANPPFEKATGLFDT